MIERKAAEGVGEGCSTPDLERALGRLRNAAAQPSSALPNETIANQQRKYVPMSFTVTCSMSCSPASCIVCSNQCMPKDSGDSKQLGDNLGVGRRLEALGGGSVGSRGGV